MIWIGLVLLAWHLSGLPFLSFPRELPLGPSLTALGFQVATISGIMLLVSCILPYRLRSGSTSDGMRLVELARKDPRSARLQSFLSLQRMILAGVRVRDIPIETINAATALQDGSHLEIFALQVRWAFELNVSLEESQRTLARIVELTSAIPPVQMGEEWLSAIAHMQATDAIYVRHDADAAEQFETKATWKKPIALASKATIEAAIASVRKSPDLATKIEAAHAAIDAATRTTAMSFDGEREWLEAISQGWPLDPLDSLEYEQH